VCSSDLYKNRVPSWRGRNIDLMFVGTCDYGDDFGRYVTRHRKQVIRDLRRVAKKYRVVALEGRRLDGLAWRRMLGRTKIVMSPWGWGEACYRDYEGLIAGCRIVKPRTPYTVLSNDGLYSGAHDALTYVDNPMAMLDGLDIDGLLHRAPEPALGRSLLAMHDPAVLGKALESFTRGLMK
jgi:hypothetical protein